MLSDPPRPIPLGSPHLGKLPMFDRWDRLPGDLNCRDHRVYTRRKLECDIWLIDLASETVVRCKTDDICDAGLYATSPVGYGLAIGQRYEVRIAGSTDTCRVTPHMAPSLGYATVVRTQMDVEGGDPHRIGFALRFDIPQLIPV